ncbi:MAG: Holliday junction branch migration protein RuvA [Coriobacteriaceae bacterium]|jgi:Holliday junction DNA helicase RuvA|nr:Holliday junction branch migration protein RuvA [Coriobacteriaceae bacterium]
MIAFIKGILAGKTGDTAFIEAGGIGYAVGMSASDLSRLPDIGQAVQLYTYLQVREDAFALFGFLALEEKTLFLQLIGVSGVGPKMALSALTLFTTAELARAIATQDIEAISRIPGVGKKTASRIVLELKGSLEKDLFTLTGVTAEGGTETPASRALQTAAVMAAAHEALLSMGFSSEESKLALKGAPEEADEAKLLQYALKRLGT